MHVIRLEFAHYAVKHGIRATVRKYNTSRNTVRCWHRKYKNNPREFLFNKHSDTHSHPHYGEVLHIYTQDICKEKSTPISALWLLIVSVIINISYSDVETSHKLIETECYTRM